MQIPLFKHLNNESFEMLILDLFNDEFESCNFVLFGRKGQKQQGIDIYSSHHKIAIQCKYKSEPSLIKREIIEQEILSEIEKLKYSNIEVKGFYFVTTFEHDNKLQLFCLEQQNQNEYEFEISYLGWSYIEKQLLSNLKLSKKYFKPYLFDNNVVFSDVLIDKENCAWIQDLKYDYTFRCNREVDLSPYPLLDFRCINNSNDTVILNQINIRTFEIPLYCGDLTTPKLPYVGVLSPITSYRFLVDYDKTETQTFKLEDPIYVMPKQPFRFII
jgi:hypothetical protein